MDLQEFGGPREETEKLSAEEAGLKTATSGLTNCGEQ